VRKSNATPLALSFEVVQFLRIVPSKTPSDFVGTEPSYQHNLYSLKLASKNNPPWEIVPAVSSRRKTVVLTLDSKKATIAAAKTASLPTTFPSPNNHCAIPFRPNPRNTKPPVPMWGMRLLPCLPSFPRCPHHRRNSPLGATTTKRLLLLLSPLLARHPQTAAKATPLNGA